MSKKKGDDRRVSITIHVTPAQAASLEAAAALAGQTRSGLVRSRVFAQSEDCTPLLACLALMVRFHHRLDDGGQLDHSMRNTLIAAILKVAEAARMEVADDC